MADKTLTPSQAKPDQDREDRLKAALKANLARRKAQARARSEAQLGARSGPRLGVEADKTGKSKG